MSSDFKTLLESVDGVRQQMEEIRNQRLRDGKQFNVYELCGVSHYELMHSRILAEILSPLGMHGQGVRFLNLFAEEFGLKEFTKDAKVFQEVKGYVGDKSVGRFDIYIEDKHSVCIIENKIFAGEQEQQLKRYRRFLDDDKQFQHMDKDRRSLIFLTLDGRRSSTLDDRYIPIPYYSKDHSQGGPSVYHWLSRCAKQSPEMVSVPLRLYRSHIEQLVIGENEMKEQVSSCLLGKMQAASLIVDHFEDARKQIQQELMNDVTGALSKKLHCRFSSNDVWSDFRVTVNGEFGWAYCVRRDFCGKKGAEAWLRVFVRKDSTVLVGIFGEDLRNKKLERLLERWTRENEEESLGKERVGYYLRHPVSDSGGQEIRFDPRFYDRICDKDKKYRKIVVDQFVDALMKLYNKLCEFEKHVKA